MIVTIALFPFNYMLKCGFQFIYFITGKEYLPILGQGKRPNSNSNTIINVGYGMPSGHSQLSWTLGCYFICILTAKIINNIFNYSNFYYFSWLVVIIFAMYYIPYSRVYIENCHTKEQVTIGCILGCICGFFMWYIENSLIFNIGVH